MKQKFVSRIVPKSVINKCLLMIAAAMVVIIAVLQLIMNRWVYRQIQPALLENYSTLMSAVGSQASYLLHQNSQFLKKIYEDEEMLEQLAAVPGISDPEQKEETVRSLALKMPAESRGDNEPGALLSSRSLIVLVDWQDWICPDDLLPYMECIAQSDWFLSLPEQLQELTERYGGYAIKSYSPVFPEEETGGREAFLSLAKTEDWKGHEIIIFLIEPFSEYLAIFAELEDNSISDYALLSYDNVLFSHCTADSFEESIASETDHFFTDSQYEVKRTEEQAGVFLGARISYTIEDMKLLVYMPSKVYMSPYSTLIVSLNFILVSLMIVLLVIILFVLKRNFSRLKILTAQMENIRQGEMDFTPKISGEDEIGVLADNFYQMMGEINANISQIRNQEKREKEIEYSLLISQIDPHFIYNALNTISYLAELKRYKDIVVINQALIEMLRDRLKISKLQIYDTLENEEKQLRYYLTIQNYLCGNRITLDFKAEDLQISYPKNILQPLVENAVFHGILLHRDADGRKLPGLVSVKITAEAGFLVTRITDNGIGMSEEDIFHYFTEMPDSIADFDDSSQNHEHIGIYNIRMRLSYLYGELYTISAVSPNHEGLEITLKIPL